jgi:hypothetical protein
MDKGLQRMGGLCAGADKEKPFHFGRVNCHFEKALLYNWYSSIFR